MSPKNSKKSKTEEKKAKVEKTELQPPATPDKQKFKPKTNASRKDTPRKKREDTAVTFSPLIASSSSDKLPLPVEVGVDGDSTHAEQGKKGDYQKLLKLQASNNFMLAKTFIIEDGEYAGYQAIYIKPSKPFQFSELPDAVRNRVYHSYFACKGVLNKPIVFDGKRTANKEAYAKTYADNSKNRVALLATNKEIHTEAVSVIYAKTLHFENTQILIDFLSQVVNARPRLRSIEVKIFNKATARNALHFLAEARNIQRLHFEHGVFAEGDPKKAAKTFYECAFRFLKAVGGSKVEDEAREDTTGVDVLSFGKGAFTLKDEKKQTKNWDDDMVDTFKKELRKRMRLPRLRPANLSIRTLTPTQGLGEDEPQVSTGCDEFRPSYE